MIDSKTDSSISEGMANRFIEHDLNQCYEQVRDYNQSIWRVFIVTIVMQISLMAFAYFVDSHYSKLSVDIPLEFRLLYFMMFLGGVSLIAIVVKMRVKSVTISRHIHSVKDKLLSDLSFIPDFRDRIFIDQNPPKYVLSKDFQSLLIHIILFVNSFFFFLSLEFVGNVIPVPHISVILMPLALFGQRGFLSFYLRSLDKKADKASIPKEED